MTSILILNGPNLNLLGRREPHLYGHETLADVEALCRREAQALGASVELEQTNHEGALVDLVHGAIGRHDGLVVNAGAYTHTSIALMDAVSAARMPAVEVHLSNVHSREDFRHHSYLARVCVGTVTGFGAAVYPLALRALVQHLQGS